ncbi:hypothetical protein NA56DRAFT_66745 [Hyaloscypha hepaticicola]|uniref:Tubby C-terminal domain-containing protein n=1 Tax=Hyaloscypha hepaticicola TaxID=2082293 RepID=A0A2J6QAK7_9HELO|nr:hypothetical protein NA56DRAFT_66745 [Hyaloscypha hepaticicola]
MDASTLFRGDEFKGSNLYTSPPEESTLQLAARNTALMGMIYGILDQRDRSTPPNFPPQVEYDLSKAKVLQWANSLPVYQSPVEKTPPAIYPEYHHSIPRSPSPVESMSSDSSGRESSLGPKTPIFSISVPTTQKRFSCGKEGRNQQAAKKPSSGFLDDSVPPRSSSYNQTDSPPSLSPVPAMKATITSLADDFMLGFVPECEDPPVKAIPKLVKPPTLRISTQILPYPITPTSARRPELVYPPSCPPAPQAAHPVSPKPSNHSPSPFRRSAEICRTAIKDLGGMFPPIRQSTGPSAKKSKQIQEHPHAQARHLTPASPNKHVRLDDGLRVGPRPPILSVVIERSRIPSKSVSVNSTSAGKQYDSRERYRRMSSVTSSPAAKGLMTPEYLRNQARYSIMPLPCTPLQVSQHMLSPTRAPPSIPLQIEQTIPSPTQPPPSIPLNYMPAQIKKSLLPLANQNLQVEQHKPVSDSRSLPVTARRTQKEIEAIPEPAVVTKLENPAGFGSNLGASDTKGLFAGEQGIQFTMSRRIITMSKIEWMIESPGGSRLLKCYEQVNSLSRKRDFFDIEGNQLFDFQRRIGSTRTAEAPHGGTLFIVKNASLHLSPHWAVSMGNTTDNDSAQWIARGDESMENVIVNWGGFQVGCISCKSGLKKHTYTVNVAPEMNYTIMAALTTVFDDLRTDEGC